MVLASFCHKGAPPHLRSFAPCRPLPRFPRKSPKRRRPQRHANGAARGWYSWKIDDLRISLDSHYPDQKWSKSTSYKIYVRGILSILFPSSSSKNQVNLSWILSWTGSSDSPGRQKPQHPSVMLTRFRPLLMQSTRNDLWRTGGDVWKGRMNGSGESRVQKVFDITI